MLTRTHTAIVIFAVLLLLPIVDNKIMFVFAALIAALIPDVDTPFSGVGKKWYFRPLQWFVKHRGLVHSFTFLALITFVFVLFLPVLAFGFFVGYGLHLFVDSFTIEGIRPFYPFKKKITGKVRVGSVVETGIFVFFVFGDIFLFIIRIMSLG